MKKFLYARLAFSGITKNKKLYLPYILSTIGAVMVYYIIHFLSCSPYVVNMVHGGEIGFSLSLGKFVIAVFSLIFLFYTNSFLTRRRYKEFGLYNILGMTKRNIAGIVIWESLYVSVIGLTSGIALGIMFSKLVELGFLKMVQGETGYKFTVPKDAVIFTLIIYIAIFLFLMIKSLIIISKTKPLKLMQSEAAGEKPIKANWIFALIGLLILGAAYYMSVTIDNPLSAILLFFVAVIMVIIATYLLFMSGSVAVCKILQKNKKYYYKKNHFISVSSMVYRMKRNGAGLASICILSTMVLVMISSSGSLYFGKEDAIKTRFPRDTEISVDFDSLEKLSDGNIAELKDLYTAVFEKHRFQPKDVSEYRYASITGVIDTNNISPNPNYDNFSVDFSKIRVVYFISLDDYNRTMGTDYTLSKGEAMLYTMRCKYNENTLNVGDMKMQIVEKLDKFIEIGEANSLIMPSLMLIIPDYDALAPIDDLKFSDMKQLTLRYHYSYNSDLPDEETIAIFNDQRKAIADSPAVTDDGGYSFYSDCIALERDGFYTTFGGLFFLGIILSIIFIFAAAVIIYYKQVSEGYEDRSRFEILQNVGMTKSDIRKTVNSQILTVFFAPLVFSGLHLGFAFPFVWKILIMFNIRNLSFVIFITAIAFALFGIFYAIIYKLTAKAYYSIITVKEDI